MPSPSKFVYFLIALFASILGILELLGLAFSFEPLKKRLLSSTALTLFAVWFVYLILFHAFPTITRTIGDAKDSLGRRLSSFLRPAGEQLGAQGLAAYREDIERAIKLSSRIYLLLVSAQTMFFDPKETFILTALRGLSSVQLARKDMLFKLLNPASQGFLDRAEWLVPEMLQYSEPWAVASLDSHTKHAP